MDEIVTSPTIEDIKCYGNLMTQTLGYPSIETSHWITKEGVENIRLIRCENKIAGGIIFWKMGQWFGGKSVPMFRPRALGILPEFRGKGLAEKLLLHATKEAYESESHISFIIPAIDKLYRRCGYERSGVFQTNSVPLANFPSFSRELSMEVINETHLDELIDLYSFRAKYENGQIDRSKNLWFEILNRFPNTYAYSVKKNQKLDGYIIYRQRQTSYGNFDLIIHDFVSKTKETTKRILTFLKDHSSVVRNVELSIPLNNPVLNDINLTHVTKIFSKHWMLKIINPQKAMICRGFPKSMSGKINFLIIDKSQKSLKHKFILELNEGEARIKDGGEGNFILSINSLAPLFTGYSSAFHLMQNGELQASIQDCKFASEIFSGQIPWVSDIF